MRVSIRYMLVAIFLATSTPTVAQSTPRGSEDSYPSRTVRLIIPFTAGGGNDVIARIAAHKLSELWGQQVLGDNRVGANGIIGTDLAAKAPPDGHTLVIASSTYTMSPTTHKLPYDAIKDLAAVGLVADGPLVLSAHPSFPAQTVKQFISLAKTKPAQLQYASSGVGGVIHLAAELLQKKAAISLVHVPYKGSSAGAIDVVSGQLPLIISSVSPVLSFLKSGQLRALGVCGLNRSSLFPDIPTIAEAGVPGYEANMWWGILAPSRTPQSIVNKINRDINRALQQQEVQQRVASLGMEVRLSTPEQYAQLIANDISKWATIINEAGLARKD